MHFALLSSVLFCSVAESHSHRARLPVEALAVPEVPDAVPAGVVPAARRLLTIIIIPDPPIDLHRLRRRPMTDLSPIIITTVIIIEPIVPIRLMFLTEPDTPDITGRPDTMEADITTRDPVFPLESTFNSFSEVKRPF